MHRVLVVFLVLLMMVFAVVPLCADEAQTSPDTPDTGPGVLPNPPEHWSESPMLWAFLLGIILMLIDVL